MFQKVVLNISKNNTDSAGNSYGCHENWFAVSGLPIHADFVGFCDFHNILITSEDAPGRRC